MILETYATYPSPSIITKRVIENLEKVLGTVEDKDGRGSLIDAMLAYCKPSVEPGNAWCAAALSYWFQKCAAGLKLELPKDFPLSAWTPDYKIWGVRNTLWIQNSTNPDLHTVVKRGDLACYYNKGAGRISHIGIVTSVDAGGFRTIEANSRKPGRTDSDPHRDGIFRHSRDYAELGSIGGFVRVPRKGAAPHVLPV